MENITTTLKKLITEHGMEILEQEQRLKAILADLHPNEKRFRYLLELSFRAEIPRKLIALQNEGKSIWEAQVRTMQHYFKEEYFLEDNAVKSVFDCWDLALCAEESDDSFEIVWRNELCGFGNLNGNMITDYKYDDARNFNDGLAWVMKDMKYGFINDEGIEIIPLKYKVKELRDFWYNSYYEPHIFSEGLINLELGGKYGFVDKKGTVVIPFNYDFAGGFNEGLASVQIEAESDYYGYINKMGSLVIPQRYTYAHDFCEGVALVQWYSEFGYINKEGKYLIPHQKKYDRYFSFNNGLAMVIKGSYQVGYNYKVGFIDKNGDEIIPVKYSEVGSFRNGLIPLKLNGKYGYYNNKGQEVINSVFDHAYDFNEGIAIVKAGKKWGFIDEGGSEIIPFKYDTAFEFEEGKSKVEIKGKWGFVNNKGVEIISPKFDKAGDFHNGLSIVQFNNKYGFIDIYGNEIIPFKYDYVDFFRKGIAYVSIDGKAFYIDKSNKWIKDYKTKNG